jgi:hypothetical protein
VQDLQEASSALIKALLIREKYMAMAMQGFPRTTARFLTTVEDKLNYPSVEAVSGDERKTIEGRQASLKHSTIHTSSFL